MYSSLWMVNDMQVFFSVLRSETLHKFIMYFYIILIFIPDPVDNVLNLIDVDLEPYAWITYNVNGIMVYNAPRPFVDEDMRQGLLIIPTKSA